MCAFPSITFRPLLPPKDLKLKFDEIFELTAYVKFQDQVRNKIKKLVSVLFLKQNLFGIAKFKEIHEKS